MLSLIIVLFSINGCKDKEKGGTKSQGQKPPSVLQELNRLTEEVVKETMKKDWSASLETTKQIQEKWSELYPELQQKGISSAVVDNFVKDFNDLSDTLIAKTLTLPRKEEENQEMKEKEKSQSSQGQSQDSKNESGGDNSKNSVKSASSSQDSTQSKDGTQQGEEEGKEKSKDPQKSLEEIDPLFDMASDELIIVDNAVELLRHIPNFSSVFDQKVPSDVLRLKYLVYHVNVVSRQAKWLEAEDTITDINSVWDSVEARVLEVDENLKMQISQSLKEVGQVVSLHNQTLVGVKSNSTIEVLKKLVEKMEKG